MEKKQMRDGGATMPALNERISVLNCIDLSDSNINESVSLLNSGFFYVKNHGISEGFMEKEFKESKKFFKLPETEKMKVLRNEKHRGYTPVLDELLDPDNQVRGDYKEGYYIGVEVPEMILKLKSRFLDVMFGHRLNFCLVGGKRCRGFHQEALEVARKVARIIALALDLDADFFDKPEMLGQPIAVMRLLHYGAYVSDPSKGIFGAGAHSDYGLITLLATDGIAGLQICKDKDARPQVWENIPPLKGAFIVNLGDMLERWSNCIFRSTLHRVVGNGQERYSIAYFVEPSHKCLVECLPTCKSEKNPPKFPPIQCGTYLSQRYKDTHADLKVYSKPQT